MLKSVCTAALCFVIAGCLVVLTGCGGGFDSQSVRAQLNSNSAQRLANLYGYYLVQNRGVGPGSEETFRKFIAEANPAVLERMNADVSDMDAMFTSDRDGQPFEIRYGVKWNDRMPAEPVVFEQLGEDGKRMVAFTGLKIEEVEDDQRYDELLSGTAK